jgi:hypothetical protein
MTMFLAGVYLCTSGIGRFLIAVSFWFICILANEDLLFCYDATIDNASEISLRNELQWIAHLHKNILDS